MEEILKSTKSAYYFYCLYGLNFIFILTSMFFLYFKQTKIKKTMLLFSFILLMSIMNPFIIWITLKYWLPASEYWKIYYIVPGGILLAYAMTVLFGEVSGKKKQWIVLGLFAIMIFATVNFDFKSDIKGLERNKYGVEHNIVELDKLLQNNQISDLELMVPENVKMQLIEYDSNIKITEIVEPADFEQTVNINTGAISYEKLNIKLSEENKAHVACIILESEYNNEAVMNEFGYCLKASDDRYYIYVRKR